MRGKKIRKGKGEEVELYREEENCNPLSQLIVLTVVTVRPSGAGIMWIINTSGISFDFQLNANRSLCHFKMFKQE